MPRPGSMRPGRGFWNWIQRKKNTRLKVNGLKESIKTFESDLNLKRSREKELGGELLELQDKRALVQKEHIILKRQAHGYRKG